MNTQVFLEEFSASTDHIIVKGKRTKRPRLSSSADFNSLPSSPASSSGISTSTEEDEDLANCLILLARGGLAPQSQNKFGSRKFTEMASTATGKVGIYLYECKTCSRTFPSFQALGGHRASHKKPKTAADCDQRRSTPPPPPKNQVKEEEDTIAPPPSTPQRLGHVDNKPKIHECSICGSEFASGQALGGHMRRHRSAPTAAPVAVAAAAKSDENDDGDSSSHNHHRHVVEKTRKILSLDLNLPAPAEEEFRAFSSKQQTRLMFAAAALVDCHY